MSAPSTEVQARGPSMSSITMIVRMVMVAAITVAAVVTALRMVCWLPASTLVTSPGVMLARRSRTWKRTSRKWNWPPGPKMSFTSVGRARIKSSACSTTGQAMATTAATSRATVANDTTSAERMRGQRWRSSQPTAGCRAMARMMPMSTHRRMVPIFMRNRIRPMMASTVSVMMVVLRMSSEVRRPGTGSGSGTSTVLGGAAGGCAPGGEASRSVMGGHLSGC